MRNISQWSRKYFSPKWKSVSAGILSREEQIEKVYRSGVPPPASSRETSQSWLILSAEWDEILTKSENYFFVWVRNISLFEWEIFKGAGKVSVDLYNIQTKIYMIIFLSSNIWCMIMSDIYMINDHIYLYLYHSLSTSMESVEQVGRRERFLQSTFESLSGGIYDI